MEVSTCFDHSCKPNAARRFNGTTMEVYALAMIDTSKDKIYLTYTTPLDARKVRQNHLKTIYNFDCQCSRCHDYEQDDRLCRKFERIKDEFVKLPPIKTNGPKRFELVFELISIYEAVYGNYGMEITNLLFMATGILFTCLNEFKPQLRKRDLLKLLTKLKDSARVTHPNHHGLKQLPYFEQVAQKIK